MKWIEVVDSGTISAIRYGPRRELLVIFFTNDRTYRCLGVPDFVYRALLRADSKGRYFGYEYEEARSECAICAI